MGFLSLAFVAAVLWATVAATTATDAAAPAQGPAADPAPTGPSKRAPWARKYRRYTVGTGLADVTGAVAGVALQGYGLGNQTAAGLRTRQYARALYVEDAAGRGVAFVNTDVCMTFGLVKNLVLARLAANGLEGVFTNATLLLAAIHTHSGPGGFSQNFLYNTATLGVVPETLEAIVNGTATAVAQAYRSRRRGVTITTAHGPLRGPGRNRSPTSYLFNPERERLAYDADVDTNHTVLRYELNGVPIALQSFYPVHGTSINNTNQLVSADNKGYAAYLTERWFRERLGAGAGGGGQPGGPFVAQFFQANEGDVSPNTLGEFCYIGPAGAPCEPTRSSCPERKGTFCRAYGPGGLDGFESARIVGHQQFEHAVQLWDRATTPVTGPIHVHWRVLPLEGVPVHRNFTNTGADEATCTGAMGTAFVAGTTDGPGFHVAVGAVTADFEQGVREETPRDQLRRCGLDQEASFLERRLVKLLSRTAPLTLADCRCHWPKLIALHVGALHFSGRTLAQWAVRDAPAHVVAIGTHAFAALPGEFTTMSGRRLRRDIERLLAELGTGQEGSDRWSGATVHLIGLANEYAGYIATPEEYLAQRYEGASTLFGPHTLGAFRQGFAAATAALAADAALLEAADGDAADADEEEEEGFAEPAATRYRLDGHCELFWAPVERLAGLVVDDLGPIVNHLPYDHRLHGRRFGEPLTDVAGRTFRPGDTVAVRFAGANPRRSLGQGEPSFLYVEHRRAVGQWAVVATDAEWETRFHWAATDAAEDGGVLAWLHGVYDKAVMRLGNKGMSEVRVEWDIPAGQPPGRYRLRYVGHAQESAAKPIRRVEGVSGEFTVAGAAP